MTQTATGLHRIKGPPGCPNDVGVTLRKRSFYITEAEYRQRECLPDFEELGWKAGV
jgi:hypothetical protein